MKNILFIAAVVAIVLATCPAQVRAQTLLVLENNGVSYPIESASSGETLEIGPGVLTMSLIAHNNTGYVIDQVELLNGLYQLNHTVGSIYSNEGFTSWRDRGEQYVRFCSVNLDAGQPIVVSYMPGSAKITNMLTGLMMPVSDAELQPNVNHNYGLMSFEAYQLGTMQPGEMKSLSLSYQIAVVPEQSSALLLLPTLAGVLARRRRK